MKIVLHFAATQVLNLSNVFTKSMTDPLKSDLKTN